jgi:hypothetical protein
MKTPDGKFELAVGLGATMGVGSDCYPYTVQSWTKYGKTISVTRDSYSPDKENGYDYYSNQVYTYKTMPDAPREIARWSTRQQCYLVNGTRLHVGERRAYQNPSF